MAFLGIKPKFSVEGAMGGAVTGYMAGGPMGALAGAGVGGVVLPTAANSLYEEQPGFEQFQQETGLDPQLQALLMQRVEGTAPSAAEQQLFMGNEMANQAAMSQAASARGAFNPALLQQQAMQQGAVLNQQTNQQAGLLRAQEADEALRKLVAADAAAKQLDIRQAMAAYDAQVEQVNEKNRMIGNTLNTAAQLGTMTAMNRRGTKDGKVST